MASLPRAPRKTPDKFAAIGRSAVADLAATEVPAVDALSRRMDDIELALEGIGRSQTFVEEYAKYCVAMRRDAEELTRIRWFALVGAALMMLAFMIAVMKLVFFTDSWFWLAGSSWKSAEIVSLVAGSVGLMIVILRGAFRTISERNQDDIVPEHLKTILEAAKQAFGGN
jgi:uncharacterized integral membrane protein